MSIPPTCEFTANRAIGGLPPLPRAPTPRGVNLTNPENERTNLIRSVRSFSGGLVFTGRGGFSKGGVLRKERFMQRNFIRSGLALEELPRLRRVMGDGISLENEHLEITLRRLRILTNPGNPLEQDFNQIGISGCPRCGGSGWISTRRPQEQYLIWPGHGWSACPCVDTAIAQFKERTNPKDGVKLPPLVGSSRGKSSRHRDQELD